MHRTIQSVYIVTKAGHVKALELAQSMAEWFAGKGLEATVFENGVAALQGVTLPVKGGLFLVLGGDGTMLSVSRRVVGLDMPVLGVNLGKVGFLAEVSVDTWQEQLQRLVDGKVRFKKRVALSCRVERGGKDVFSGVAVNDLVIHRGALARVINLDLFVDDEELGTLRADGLIVSTPTGATGYAVSAHGPLVHPDLDAFSVTPICPFLSNFMPLVLRSDMEFSTVIKEANTDLFLTQDGQEGIVLKVGDRIVITSADNGLLFAELGTATYFSKLRTRGFIAGQG